MYGDLYYKVNSYALNSDYNSSSTERKKEIIDEGLKEYILSKLPDNESYKELDLIDLFTILVDETKEETFNTLRFFIHYILDVAGALQGRNIIWCEQLDFKKPSVEFDEEIWDKLETSKDTSYKDIFFFVHDIFMSHFMCKEKNLVKKD